MVSKKMKEYLLICFNIKHTHTHTHTFFKIKKTQYEVLRDAAVEVRVIKSEAEIALLQRVNDIGSDAHIATIRHAKPGLMEFQLESLFLHHCYYNGGCRHSPYTSICGCGINAATLHYGHSGAPNDFKLEDGQVMLMDMGCESLGYGSDISCSFPVNGKFTADQKLIFDTIALAQTRVMQAMQPGVQWMDMHELALRTVAEGLLQAGVLVGPLDEIMKAGVPTYFMPHGLGHLVRDCVCCCCCCCVMMNFFFLCLHWRVVFVCVCPHYRNII
jgi:Xaa-Pro dipeptidase